MIRGGWDHYLRTDHLEVLVDDTGIIQHASGAVPNRETGYCVDDVARLVVVAAGLHRLRNEAGSRRMVLTGLAFLDDALPEDPGPGNRPGMRNFMSYDRRWLDEPHLGDMVGRTVWALGVAVSQYDDEQGIAGPAHRLLHRTLPLVARFDTLHEWVYAALGLSFTAEQCDECREALSAVAGRLMGEWEAHARPDWPWPQDVLTYDNPRTPQALLRAGAALGRQGLVARGRDALDWFLEMNRVVPEGDDAVVATVGNHWLRRGEELGEFSGDEQPIDTGALVECLVDAAEVLERPELLELAEHAFGWFLGANRLGLALFDPVSGGCRDGLGVDAVNQNQGAESTLAFLQAGLALAFAGCPAPRSVGDAPQQDEGQGDQAR